MAAAVILNCCHCSFFDVICLYTIKVATIPPNAVQFDYIVKKLQQVFEFQYDGTRHFDICSLCISDVKDVFRIEVATCPSDLAIGE